MLQEACLWRAADRSWKPRHPRPETLGRFFADTLSWGSGSDLEKPEPGMMVTGIFAEMTPNVSLFELNSCDKAARIFN